MLLYIVIKTTCDCAFCRIMRMGRSAGRHALTVRIENKELHMRRNERKYEL